MHRAFNLSFVVATPLLVCALVSLAWWSKHGQQHPDVVATGPLGLASSPAQVGIEKEEVNLAKPVSKGDMRGANPRVLRLQGRRKALLMAVNRNARLEAKTMASWQSPTAILLNSQSDELLKSLPQLNQTVDELRSFLPSQPR